MLSLLTQFEHIFFPNLTQLKDLLLPMQFNPRKEVMQLTPQWSIPPFSNWCIWLLTQTCRCVFTWVCQCHLELEVDRKFCTLVTFFHQKALITKNANVFHIKLGGSRRFNYFSISIPSRHTSHHRGQSIASHWFFTYKYGWPSTSNRLRR